MAAAVAAAGASTEQDGEKLRIAWKEKLSTSSQNAQSAPNVALPDEVTKKVNEMLDDLGPYVNWVYAAGGKVASACGELKAPGDKSGKGTTTDQMKRVCKTLVQAVHWMGNLEKDGKKRTKGSTAEDEWKQYLRCVIGYEFLLRVLLPKYEVEKFMKIIFDTMERGGTEGALSSAGGICPWVKVDDVRGTEELIGSQVQEWLNNAKKDKNEGGIEGFDNIVAWSRYAEGTADMEEERAKRKGKISQSDKIIDLLRDGVSNPLEVLVDQIAKANHCIENAEKDANSGKENALCNRLKCIEEYLKKQPLPGSPGGPKTGQLSATEDFWNKKVKELWEELAGAMMQENGKTTNAECTKVKDGSSSPRDATHSEKTACNYLHAGFKELYNPSTPDGVDDILSKKNPSFRHAMGCFLLRAYANEMKKRSTCLIDKGIEKAFQLGKELSNGSTGTNANCNGNGKCIPCKWNENAFKDCQVKTEDNGVEKKATEVVEKIVQEDTTKIKDMQTKINDMKLCERFQCISERWLKKDRSNGDPLTSADWDRVRSKVTSQIAALGDALKDATTQNKRTEFELYCKDIPAVNGKPADKDACVLIAAGLRNLYKTAGDGVEESLKRTMQCVLLNAIADKMKDKLPCEQERSVEKGIDHAFGQSATIKSKSSACGTDDKCFTCPRFKDYKECQIKENDSSKEVLLKDQIDHKLEDTNLASTTSLTTSSLTKTICKPCTGDEKGDFCQELNCVVDKWGERKNGSSSGTTTWEKMKSDFETELKLLLEDMQNPTKQAAVASNCTGVSGGQTWSDSDAHGFANKTACKLVAAGLEHISKIQHEYSGDPKTGQPEKNENPYDNQEFKQFISCLMLKAVAQKMKEDSKICDIDQGIRVAFTKAQQIASTNCKNGKPCIECKLADKYDECYFDKKQQDKVNDKLDSLLKTQGSDVNNILFTITKTGGNSSSNLCLRLQCLASRVQASSSADEFWTNEGEVGQLWTQLSEAMIHNADKNNGQCNIMDNGTTGAMTRQATDPERKACQYLTAGFTKLRTISATTTNGGNNILDKHPSLKQTVGCFLLKEYAKHMKDNAKCLVESGIKKAFDIALKNLNGSCTGEGPCVPCHWKEKDYDTCQIHTTGPNIEDVKRKVQGIVETKSVPNAMEDINKMTTLCDYIKCAAPKWFHNQKNSKNQGGNGTAKTWCDFWENEGVRPELKKMFDKIASEGQNKPTSITIGTTCRGFGDGNPDSVERKACNHITAGLEYIDGIKPDVSGSGRGPSTQSSGQGNQLLQQAVGCIALNLYADQIIAKSSEKCPIGEDKISRMFTDWNTQHNSLSSNSCNDANKNNCFKCDRVSNSQFNDCKLSVSNTLINATQNVQNCTSNTGRENVQTELNKFLNENNPSSSKSIPEVKKTLSEINKMDSFCSQMQCAAKQYYVKAINKNVNSSEVKW
ncbi:SICAvar, type I (fragment), partial [Plasmodium knowlesi strain H]